MRASFRTRSSSASASSVTTSSLISIGTLYSAPMESQDPRAARTVHREVAPSRRPAAAGTILGMAPFFPSDRDRLLIAFANLAKYDKATLIAYSKHATEAHAAIPA